MKLFVRACACACAVCSLMFHRIPLDLNASCPAQSVKHNHVRRWVLMCSLLFRRKQHTASPTNCSWCVGNCGSTSNPIGPRESRAEKQAASHRRILCDGRFKYFQRRSAFSLSYIHRQFKHSWKHISKAQIHIRPPHWWSQNWQTTIHSPLTSPFLSSWPPPSYYRTHSTKCPKPKPCPSPSLKLAHILWIK